ncbi:MAG: efflux RND transporter periplasmic adaptor subunit [bacterium]|nr:efflux RND transporter periplasmic adaptor subunit [bacterium]
MFEFIKRPKTIIAIVVLMIVVVAGYNYLSKPKAPSYDFIVAQNKNLTQEVSVTGKIKSAESLDLAFERSGKINSVSAKIGDSVKAGQILAAIDSAELSASLSGARAQLESAKVRLDELTRGTRPEEIKIAETGVSSAQNSLADAKTSLENAKQTASINLANLYGKVKDILNDAYAKSDNALNTQISSLFSNATTSNPQLTFTTTNSQAKTDAESQRVLAESALKALKSEVDNTPSDYPGLDNSLINSENQLIIMRNFLTKLSTAVNYAAGLSSATLDAYKASVNTAWTNTNAAITSINNQEQLIASQRILNQTSINSAENAVNSAQNALRSAEDTLALKKAGSASEQIDAQRAQVKQVEAQVRNYEIQIGQSYLKSPIDGIVTKQDAKVGEIISPNAIIVSVISEAKFQIEANIAEADIAKVKINDPANITLDAYGSDMIFEAKVISIDPAETVIEGVSTYKTTLEFTKKDDQIKSGMTANIDILTAKKENVIAIPQRVVITKDGQKFVLIDAGNGRQEERKIETGLRGSDGNIEITSGLNAGEKIIISVTQ